MGLGRVVQRTHPKLGAPGVNIGLSYIQQAGDPACTPGQPGCDAGDKYIGLDRFGRVVDQRWISSDSIAFPLDRFQYGYDRNSNRLYRNNMVNTAFGELYQASGAGYGYDVLNQMTDFARGTLSSSNPPNGPLDTIATPSTTKNWNFDIVGNWNSVCTNGTGTNCTGGTLQSRMHNRQNEVTQVGSTGLSFDNNGNTTQDETGKTLKFDAWNRLVTVNPGATPLASYTFDALGRRIQETHSSATTDLYFSQSWQVLEEDQGGLWNAQYVWSPVYVDALVERNTISRVSTSRVYVQQDTNFNVTSISDPTGAVQEREVYDPNGAVTFYNNLWQNPSSQSSYSWVYLHQGGRLDSSTGFYNFRNREYSPTLGRWLQVDPIAYFSGDSNLYRYVRNNSPNWLDSLGLKILSESDAPKDIVFTDEAYWSIIIGGNLPLSPPKEIRDKNIAAAKKMIEWRNIKDKCFTFNVFYITDADSGPEQFLKDAVKKGPGTLNLFFGHGEGQTGQLEVQIKDALKNMRNPTNAPPPLFGIGSCYATLYNGCIPIEHRMPNIPTNKDAILIVHAPTFWTPMIEETDRIIKERIKSRIDTKLNLYFGEWEKRKPDDGLLVGNTLAYGKEPIYRYRQWK
jgi:RHS repeat-associated protein